MNDWKDPHSHGLIIQHERKREKIEAKAKEIKGFFFMSSKRRSVLIKNNFKEMYFWQIMFAFYFEIAEIQTEEQDKSTIETNFSKLKLEPMDEEDYLNQYLKLEQEYLSVNALEIEEAFEEDYSFYLKNK